VVVLLGTGGTAGSAYADDAASPVASEPAGGATCDPQLPPNGCTQDPGSPSPGDSSGDPSPSGSSGDPSTTPSESDSSTPSTSASTDPGTVPATTPATTSSPVPSLPHTGGTLPRTGGDDAQTSLLVGVALLAAGAAVLTGVRPRRRH
jgi:LPXTG-motif cell wall-anchored protein